MDQNQILRIVLLGKTGSGKSSLGNVIFGEECDEGPFKTSDSSVSETNECKSVKKEINGKTIQLTDIPGFFDTKQDTEKTKAEILKSLQECAPGPHAFLLVLKVERYTQQEQEVVEEMLKCFSEEMLKYSTVVFTHGEQLRKGRTIEDWAGENEALKNLVQKCGRRVHVLDNKYWNNSQDPDRNNQKQVTELLNTIDQTVETNGGYYTNSFWQQIRNIKVLDIPLTTLLAGIAGGIVLVGAGIVVAKGLAARDEVARSRVAKSLDARALMISECVLAVVIMSGVLKELKSNFQPQFPH